MNNSICSSPNSAWEPGDRGAAPTATPVRAVSLSRTVMQNQFSALAERINAGVTALQRQCETDRRRLAQLEKKFEAAKGYVPVDITVELLYLITIVIVIVRSNKILVYGNLIKSLGSAGRRGQGGGLREARGKGGEHVRASKSRQERWAEVQGSVSGLLEARSA